MTGRREFIHGLTAGAALMLPSLPLLAQEDKMIPFAGGPAPNAARRGMVWDELTSWTTPTDGVFAVQHYGVPEGDPAVTRLEISCLVGKQLTLSMEQIKARPRVEHTVTIECSGNAPAGPLIGNSKWAGTPLAPLLKEAGLKPEGIEVVFFGTDSGTEKIRDAEYKQNFARSLSVEDATKNNVILCYEQNGAPLVKAHGGPLRLVVPGWYGVAWVKWLSRIEVHDRKFSNRFMARDYVTIRGEKQGDQTIWRETSVGRMNLKSVAARVTRRGNGPAKITGAAWGDGTAISKVEVRIDEGPWRAAQLTPNRDQYAWTFWSFDWNDIKPGEHSIASRATDAQGRVQPAPDDPFITQKKSRWENNQQAVRKIVI